MIGEHIQQLQKKFEKEKHVFVPSIITTKDRNDLTYHMLDPNNLSRETSKHTNKVSYYSRMQQMHLLIGNLGLVEAVTKKNMLPTYSYCRLYKQHDELYKHTDREACEYSITAMISSDGSTPWPIFLELDGKSVHYIMNPGDLLVYKGRELPHWRPKFTGDWHIQLFLHYVDAEGESKDLIWDKIRR
jgi:hypothetical protein